MEYTYEAEGLTDQDIRNDEFEIDYEHVDYPHFPGMLYDCAGCELGPCQCDGVGCVSQFCREQESHTTNK